MTDSEFDLALADGCVARCRRVFEQDYLDGCFSAGLVDGVPPDSFYLRLERNGEPWTILLRLDEMLAIVMVCSAALWSQSIGAHLSEEPPCLERSTSELSPSHPKRG